MRCSRTASERALSTPSARQLASMRTRMVVRTPRFLQWENASRESYPPSPRMVATGGLLETRRSLATVWQQPQSHMYSVIVSVEFSSAGASSTSTDTDGSMVWSSSGTPSLSRASSSIPGRFLASPPPVSVIRNASIFWDSSSARMCSLMKLHFTFHLSSIHLPLPVVVMPVESATRTCVLPLAVLTVMRLPFHGDGLGAGPPPYGNVIGALHTLAQHRVNVPLGHAQPLAEHVPDVGDAAHQQVRVYERPPPLGAVHLVQLVLPLGAHPDDQRPAQRHAPGILLGRRPLGLAVPGGVGRPVLLSRHDL
jgi:hypothetical protein